MKTKRHNSLNEIVFENKNKAYGAYHNRITAGFDLMKSLFITIFAIGILAIVLSFTIKNEEPEIIEDEGVTVIIDPTVTNPPEKEKPAVVKQKPEVKPKTIQSDKTNQLPAPKANPPVQTEVLDHDDLSTPVSPEGNPEGTDVTMTPNHNENSTTENGNAEENTEGTRTVYKVREVTQMAVFPGCEKFTGNNGKLQNCLAEQLQKELSSQLSDFEVVANRQGIHEAVAKVQFIIDKSGKIIEIKTLNGGNKELSEDSREALERISKRMIQKGKYIEPAKFKDGTPVNLMFTIPVKFVSN